MPAKRVLIVDDQRDIRQLLRFGLEVLGPEVNIIDVPSGEEAMLVISRQKFDLLVSDVRLAGMSGLELIRKVRQRNPSLRVILITGMTDSEIRQQVTDAGAEFFFFKPVEMADFQAAVRHCLELDELTAPPPPMPISELEKPPVDLFGRLLEISRRLGGAEILLADGSGQKISVSGSLPAIFSHDLSRGALRAAGAAMLELLRVLPRENPGFESSRGYFYIGGKENELHLAPVDARLVLLAITSPTTNRQPQEVMEYLLQAAADLATVDLQAILEELPAAQPEPEIEAGSESELSLLNSVFQQSGEQKMDDQAIEHYWDALAEQGEAGRSPDSGAISYDQARRLGLAPVVEET